MSQRHRIHEPRLLTLHRELEAGRASASRGSVLNPTSAHRRKRAWGTWEVREAAVFLGPLKSLCEGSCLLHPQVGLLGAACRDVRFLSLAGEQQRG